MVYTQTKQKNHTFKSTIENPIAIIQLENVEIEPANPVVIPFKIDSLIIFNLINLSFVVVGVKNVKISIDFQQLAQNIQLCYFSFSIQFDLI
jgi:hypothetical protein